MQNLNLTLIQTHLEWENAAVNRNHIEHLISALNESTDVIVLPEMFTTAFTMNSAVMAEPMNGESISWMKAMAKAKNAAICGSLIIEENGGYVNRFVWIEPEGRLLHYDKRHLFRMADEHHFFTAGESRIIIDYKGWRICPQICYDLRFPVWSRNQASHPYDLLIYVANWPSPRASAWSKLLMARAIENQAFVVGVNRIGEDEKGLSYIGGSAAIDSKGEIIWEAQQHKEEVKTVMLSMEDLSVFRKKFPLALDADEFMLRSE